MPPHSTGREITKITSTRATFTNRNTDGKLNRTTEMIHAGMNSVTNTGSMKQFRDPSAAGIVMDNYTR